MVCVPLCLCCCCLSKKGFILFSLPVFTAFICSLHSRCQFQRPFPLFAIVQRGLCWVLLYTFKYIQTSARVNICVNITLVFNFSQIMRTTLREICYALQKRGGRTCKIKKSINIAGVLCATPTVRTLTHAYKMFNINICKFLEQRRRIKTHAWNSYKLQRVWEKGTGKVGGVAVKEVLFFFLIWGVGNQHLIRLLSFSSEGMCAMDAAAAAKFFFGVRLESRREWLGGGWRACVCLEGVAGSIVAVLHMRQDLHVLHATDNSIKCRYFNSLLSLSLSSALPHPFSPSISLLSDVTHVACRMLTRLLPLNIRFDAFWYRENKAHKQGYKAAARWKDEESGVKQREKWKILWRKW